MKIKSIALTNYTVFPELKEKFCDGINVFIGENATGKTHLLKLLYSACRSNRADTDFAHKIVRTMMPDDYSLARLSTRKAGTLQTTIRVVATDEEQPGEVHLTASFSSTKTKKWAADITGKDRWEKEFSAASSIFIPAKEILSHSYKLAAATSVDNVRFDDTYIDIINSAKIDISMGRPPKTRTVLLEKIEQMTNGKVWYDDAKDEFYLKKGSSKQEFNLVAEGIKKMGLLWMLAKNGTLEKGSILFWDEPEANINPAYISTIAELLMELERNGVQIFLSTHNYFLAKYLEIYRTDSDKLKFFSLYRSHADDPVSCETSDQFTLLENNPIVRTYLQVFRDEIGVKLG